MNTAIDFTKDAPAPPTNDQLTEISDLARSLLAQQKEVAEVEKKLKEAKAALKAIEEDRLPTALLALGMRSFTLMDGTGITVKTEYHPSIPVAKRAAAYAWLREHDYDALIKRSIEIKFGKGEDATADEFLALVRQALPPDVQLTDEAAVHPQTLKAFVKECITEGDIELPRELFGVHEINRAVIA